jgi:hypothetical protein
LQKWWKIMSVVSWVFFTLEDNHRETNLQQMIYVNVGWIDDWIAECADVADAEWTTALAEVTNELSALLAAYMGCCWYKNILNKKRWLFYKYLLL